MKLNSVLKRLVAASCMLPFAASALCASAVAGSYEVLHIFTLAKYPSASPVMDAAGNLYGVTERGGTYDCGVIYQLKPNANGTWTHMTLHQFNGADGRWPQSSLILDAAGNLYGTTYSGGPANNGVIFRLTRNANGSWTETVLHHFYTTPEGYREGYGLLAPLTFGPDGNLYGTAVGGGNVAGSPGIIFELVRNSTGTWPFRIIHTFGYWDGNNGVAPEGGLTFDKDGNIYGTTFDGGAHRQGTVFKMTPGQNGDWSFEVLHSFESTPDGQWPWGTPVFDAAGNLYGSTYSGGVYGQYGTIYRLSPQPDGSWAQKTLYSFKGADGRWVGRDIVVDLAGAIYGTASQGGSYNNGLVFKLIPQIDGSFKEVTLHTFAGSGAYSGKNPDSGLISDHKGHLFGVTRNGSNFSGLVFKLTP